MTNHRELAYLFLRLTMAVIFLFYGFNKFGMGIGNFAAGFQERFGDQLPLFLLTAFAYLLPCVEVILGVLLLGGLFTGYALGAAAVLMVVLTFGAVIEPNPPTVANNAVLALVLFVLLFLLNHNRGSLDFLREARGREKPRPQGRGDRRFGPQHPRFQGRPKRRRKRGGRPDEPGGGETQE